MGTRRVMLLGALGATPLVCVLGLAALADQAQPAPAPTFGRPIVEQIQPGQQYLLLQRAMTSHPVELRGQSFATVLVESNPVIFTGRVTRKEPAFIDVWNSGGGGQFTVVPLADATWEDLV